MNWNVSISHNMEDLEPDTTPTEVNSRITGKLKIQLNLDRSMHQEVKRLSWETGLNGHISAEIKYLQ